VKTRIISGVVAITLFIAVFYFLPAWVVCAAVVLLGNIGLYELLYTAGAGKHPALFTVSVVFFTSFTVLSYLGVQWEIAFYLIYGLALAMFAIWLFRHQTVKFADVEGAFFGTVILSLFFTSMLRINAMENGKYLFAMPFIAPLMSDTCAYFTGSFIGKHKLCPTISPKKTVEGMIGGLVGGVLGLCLYGLMLEKIWNFDVNFLLLAAAGLFGAVVGQLGDLNFSMIKRAAAIKDYGRIMPGHGGVLDRLDSVLFVLPGFELLFHLTKVIF